MLNNVDIASGGRTLSIKTGKLAGQANGAVIVQYGETVVLATACASKSVRADADFLPLSVDYEEKLYAAGKIPGGFIRREGRPSQEAVLACRLIDRPIRPLFPKGLRNELQVVVTVLSVDQENDPDVIAVIAGSAALHISDIPFEGPIGAVRVGYLNGEYVINPTYVQLKDSPIDLIVAGTGKAVVMLEGGCKEVSEDLVINGIKFGQQANQDIIAAQEKLREQIGKPKITMPLFVANPQINEKMTSMLGNRLADTVKIEDKTLREKEFDLIKEELTAKLQEEFPVLEITNTLEAQIKAAVRKSILEQNYRPGGRKFNEIRPISCEISLLPRTHGSGLFTRGKTQVLTISTLGSPGEEQHLDGLGLEDSKRFMHHYNMPPFSNGEVHRLGNPGRREIGHGALVERALFQVLPKEDVFPYTIRLVSEVLSSNGSTSMASVCAGSLSLMDAGVPIKAPVSGIAMGLVTKDDKYAILTDIEGMEDAYGDLDFKVAGTAAGITAIQLDIKLKGLSYEIIEKALAQAHEARLTILDKMAQIITAPKGTLSKYAPRITKISIPQGKIGSVIGPGGRTIRAITDETKATIDIENDGTVTIGATSAESSQAAIRKIEELTREVEVGGVYTGKVTRILNFGALVEILPGKEGLVHVSELADYRVRNVEDVVKVGDEITVSVTEIDRLGRVNLSRRAIFDAAKGTGPATPGAGHAAETGDKPRGNFRQNPGFEKHDKDNRGTSSGFQK